MAGQNSTISLQDVIDEVASFAELQPTLATGGYSVHPAISIGNDVLNALLLGTIDGHPMNFKWNRLNISSYATGAGAGKLAFNSGAFFTNSNQQDYFVPGVVNLGWMESCWAANITQTSDPKQKLTMEVHRDLAVTYDETGYPAKICWMQNDTMLAGVWGQTQAKSPTGLLNPGPGVTYYNPLTLPNAPTNPVTCVSDANGNLWVVTTYGTCGNGATYSVTNPNGDTVTVTDPFGPTAYASYPSPVYPTFTKGQNSVTWPAGGTTTVTDGTTVWTAINPKGQGFRLSPVPPQSGVTWLIFPTSQMRVPRFSALTQTLEPVPDDWYSYFKAGFIAYCYRYSPDPRTRAKFKDEWETWAQSLDNAVKQGQREIDDFGFYPGNPGVMDTGWAVNPTRPDWPFGPWVG